MKGEDYPRCLKDSLAEMKSRSDRLIHQAKLSNMWQTRQVWESTKSSLYSLCLKQARWVFRILMKSYYVGSEKILAGVNLVLDHEHTFVDHMNQLKALLDDFTSNLDRSSREYMPFRILRLRSSHYESFMRRGKGVFSRPERLLDGRAHTSAYTFPRSMGPIYSCIHFPEQSPVTPTCL